MESWLWAEYEKRDNPARKHLELKDNTIKIYLGKELGVETTYYFEFNKIYNAEEGSGSFSIFKTIEWVDGYLISLDEKGQETRFVIPIYEKIEDF